MPNVNEARDRVEDAWLLSASNDVFYPHEYGREKNRV